MSMQMTPANDLKPLQVRLPGLVLEEFKTYAQEQGQSMASLVLGWIEAALAGSPPAPVSPAGAGSQPAAPEHLERLAQQVELLSSLQEQAVLQTQLLQQLTHQAAHTPYGGPGAELATESEPAVVAPSFRAQLAAMGGGEGGVRRSSAPPPRKVTPPPTPPTPPPAPRVEEPVLERNLEGMAPLVPDRKLFLEDDWQVFRGGVEVLVTLADGTELAVRADGRTANHVCLKEPAGGWPGGDGNRRLINVVAPIDAVKFEEEPELLEKGPSLLERMGVNNAAS